MINKRTFYNLFANKNILVTGGLGSIGSEITNQLLLYNPKHVVILDNRETELFYAQKLHHDKTNLEYLLGDIRDKELINKAAENIDIIFHTAALKHVVICENHPIEAIKTNVIGTQNVVEAALYHKVGRIIMISTDKAVNPINVMGATKLLGERLFSALCNNRAGDTKFGIVRFGNVLGSRGSVLEIWNTQLKKGKKITISNPEMTRFFLSIPDSVNLIFKASYYADNGETFILKMPSIKIADLAKAFLHLNGSPDDFSETMGTCAGEKMHEALLFEEESGTILENEEMFVRLPSTTNIEENMKRFKKFDFIISNAQSFSSNKSKYLLNQSRIERVLTRYNKPQGPYIKVGNIIQNNE